MDYVMTKRSTLVSKIDTGDMNNEPKEDEAITFEDIKPMCQCTQVKMVKLCMMY